MVTQWLKVVVFVGLASWVFAVYAAEPKQEFDFTLKDMQGKSHSVSEYRGKWVLVNFWATWCPPCREEMPALSDMHDNNDAIVVIGVNYHEPDTAKVTKFLEGMLLDFPIWRLPEGEEVPETEEVRALPTSLLISPEGKLVAQFAGEVNIKGVEQYIKTH